MSVLRFYKNEYIYIRVDENGDNYAPYIRITPRERTILSRNLISQSNIKSVFELGGNEFRVRVSDNGELTFKDIAQDI